MIEVLVRTVEVTTWTGYLKAVWPRFWGAFLRLYLVPLILAF